MAQHCLDPEVARDWAVAVGGGGGEGETGDTGVANWARAAKPGKFE